jgi:UDP-glucose 4-epimerase
MAAELLVHNYANLYAQEFTILRYGIPFGPRMRDALVIPRFLQMASNGQTITLHGDGSQFRNYVYVEDLAEAHVLALSDAGANEVFNLEGEHPITLRHVIESIREILDRNVVIESVPARPGDYEAKAVSNLKAQKLLGWAPHTSFEEGLRRYVEWYSRGEELDARVDQA